MNIKEMQDMNKKIIEKVKKDYKEDFFILDKESVKDFTTSNTKDSEMLQIYTKIKLYVDGNNRVVNVSLPLQEGEKLLEKLNKINSIIKDTQSSLARKSLDEKRFNSYILLNKVGENLGYCCISTKIK